MDVHAPLSPFYLSVEPQGDAEFEFERCRLDPRKDWPLLQRLSCRDPELFWGALLRDELRLPFATPPKRCGEYPNGVGTMCCHRILVGIQLA